MVCGCLFVCTTKLRRGTFVDGEVENDIVKLVVEIFVNVVEIMLVCSFVFVVEGAVVELIIGADKTVLLGSLVGSSWAQLKRYCCVVFVGRWVPC